MDPALGGSGASRTAGPSRAGAATAPGHGPGTGNHKAMEHNQKTKKKSKPPVPLRLSVITVSDTCSRGQAEDVSGPTGVVAVREVLESPGRVRLVDEPCIQVVPDDESAIRDAIQT